MTARLAVFLLVLGNAGLGLAADEAKPGLNLEQARQQGREKSRYLRTATEIAPTADAAPQADLAAFRETIGPLLRRHCQECHGPDRTEGRLRIDALNPDLLTGPDVNLWREVYGVLSKSEMPPADEPDYALSDADRGQIVDWLSGELETASRIRRRSREQTSFRRLTNYEYSYALQDLLGLPHPLANKLPPESTSEDGFKNSSELLQMSAMQFETYRELALKSLKRAIVTGERPPAVRYFISMSHEMTRVVGTGNESKVFHRDEERYRQSRHQPHLFQRESGNGIAWAGGKSLPGTEAAPEPASGAGPVVLVLPASSELKLDLDRFLPDDGVMRVRIRVGRSTLNPDEFASLRLIFSAHTSNDASFAEVVSHQDIPVTAPAENPQFVHFDIPLGDIQRNPFRHLATTFPRRDEYLHIRNVSSAPRNNDPLQVQIDQIEITAPFYEQWPPRSHTDIFFESEHRGDEQTYGREVLSRFLGRVWRRPVRAPEVDPFMALLGQYRSQFPTFEEAMVEVLATALTTPEFLYLTQRESAAETSPPAQISDVELASRLAVFLWCSLPDRELVELAERGQLRDPAVLSAQVQRLLGDPRARRFSRHFVEQWLGLDRMESVTHVGAEDPLRGAMLEEPVACFEEVLKHNRSVLDFLHADYVVVNERLAAHYGIRGVHGPQFRSVPVTAETHRGGLLTSAAVLTMNSDGTDSHPLKRGVWMLRRILDDPPPPPPPNVPEVDLTDPEILKMTLKERIIDHRNKPACYSCHSRIDPWGIAFENYDALGAYRTQIRNQPIDATAELFNRQTLSGIEGLKLYLLTDRQDQFARALVHKLMAFALGRPLTFGDSAALDELTVQFRRKNDGLRDLLDLIVTSDLFHSK